MIVKYIILFVTVELVFDVGYNREQQFFSNGDNLREIQHLNYLAIGVSGV